MKIQHGTIKEVVELSDLIPEFYEPHRAAEYEKRLTNVPHLILIAKINEKLAGFK
jgi:hypothetical protein